MQIRDTGLAALAVAGFGLWLCLSPSAQAEPNKTTAKPSSDAPIVLSKFNKHKTHASAATKSSSKTKSRSAQARHGAKLADAATRGKSANSDEALKKLAALPSVANARAELTGGNLQARADDDARNLAAADDNEIVIMNGVQIAAADQLNDIDRALGDDKTEVKADDVPIASPSPAPPSGRIIKAVPSGERHMFTNEQSNPWSNSSLIGKIFVAFGSLLTLASAARLIIA